MFRTISTLWLSLFAAPAAAHPGHLAELAGHNHWVAGAAIGAAIALVRIMLKIEVLLLTLNGERIFQRRYR